MNRIIAVVLVLIVSVSYMGMTASASDDPYGKLAFGYTFDGENLDEVLGKNRVTYYEDYDITDGKYVDGKVGKALQFVDDGETDPIWLDIPLDTLETDCFTVTFWYKATSYETAGEDSEIFTFFNPAQEKFLYYSPMKTDGAWTYIMKWGGSTEKLHYYDVWANYEDHAFLMNEWVHVAFSWVSEDSSNTSSVKLYINGTLIPGEGNEAWTDTFYSLGIKKLCFGGMNPYKAAGNGCLYHGAIDSLYFFNDELSAGEIAFLYRQTESYKTLEQQPIESEADPLPETTELPAQTEPVSSEITTVGSEGTTGAEGTTATAAMSGESSGGSVSAAWMITAAVFAVIVAGASVILIRRKKAHEK